ncbi:dTDP-glucose 4,6-dehydratase [Streptomyces indicus]|uniref:dTDP-glucose 4,6-dehydratase n=1 Tax=Streptomyces indicus TaxID=417292 RepID=A0A1G9APE0_9ACTN|nr:dTDP-glucose 4,6-dehydratase [Streptomyces indicus]SDK29246.1 dTDP-glucose 4,6-dehydratase [Streptomyces indicus]
MRILVTGGAGFIGSHYVRTLLGPDSPDPHAEVTVLDALTYAGRRDNLPAAAPGFSFVQGDVCDGPLVDELAAHHDHIVHFAAESHVDRSIADPAAFIRTNVLGTQTLLDAALRHGRRVVLVSTDEVYGSIDRGAWTEDAPLAPRSPYSASKASADLLALAQHRTHGLDVRITRSSNTYGTHQYPEKIIPLFVARLLRGERVPLYGDGRNVRDWLHVDDHVAGVDLVRREGRAGEVYHIAGGTELSNRELTGRLLALLGAGWDRVAYVADRPGHDLRYALDDRKIRALGHRTLREFTEGLKETVEWYVRHPQWWAGAVSGPPTDAGTPLTSR